MNYRQTIKDQGWVQGKCIFVDDLPQAYRENFSSFADDSVLIALTHSCCMLHDDIEEEPYVEFLVAQKTDSINGNEAHGKNPRRLSIHLTIYEGAMPVRISAKNKMTLERELLCQICPNENIYIDNESLHVIKWWAMARITSTAMPDAFDSRIEGRKREKLKKALNSNAGMNVERLLIWLDPWDELSDSETYNMELQIVYDEEFFSGPEADENEPAIEELEHRIHSILSDTQGINLRSVVSVGLDSVSLNDMKFWSNWSRWDYISNREEEHTGPPGINQS